MTKITVYSAFCDTIEIEQFKHGGIKPGYVYITQDHSFDILKHLETIEEMKREHKRLQARYDNVLKGLKYWKGKCKA